MRAAFSQRFALCKCSELRTMALALKSDCTLVFTLVVLVVEGLEVFAALGLDIVAVLVLIVAVVVQGGEAARRIAMEMVLWLVIGVTNTRHIEQLVGVEVHG